MIYNVHQAKTQFSKLIEAVRSGREVTVAKDGVPVAKLVPIGKRGKRSLGFMPVATGNDALAPLPVDELDRWSEK